MPGKYNQECTVLILETRTDQLTPEEVLC